jgi:peroxiredoxin Q/BCP
VKSHIGFIEKKGFQYSLLADTEKTMLNDFEVWGPKKFMGREYDGVLRSTIIINEEGKVSHVVEKVKTKTHGEQLMEILG